MSGFIQGLIWRTDIPGANITRKAVFACYADRAADDGSRVFPSKASIARSVTCELSTVKRATKWLVEVGLMEVVREGQGGHAKDTTEYRIRIDKLLELAGKNEPEKCDSETSKVVALEGVKPVQQYTRCSSTPGAAVPKRGGTGGPQYVKETSYKKNIHVGSGKNHPDLEKIWQLASQPMRGRSSRKLLAGELKKVFSENPNLTVDEICLALSAYLKSDDVKKDIGQPAIHRWIRDERYEAFMPRPIDWLGAVGLWRAHGKWRIDLWGPEPGKPGCRVPDEFLKEEIYA